MDKPIRVAHIMGKLSAGGVENVVFNYYRAINKNRVQFDFYYDADSTVEPPKDLIDMGARFIKIPPYQHLPNYLKALKKHFKVNNYIIVHSHINTLSVFPLFMAWRCDVPVRIAHNHSVPSGENIIRTTLKYILRSFSRVFPTDYFACSEKAGRWLFGNKNFDNGKVTVVKNAVDFNRFDVPEKSVEALRKIYNLKDKFVVGHVGRFTFAKNHEFLIKVFKQISDIRNDAVLMLVGDGELNKQIHQWVEDYGVAENTIFVGQVTNPEVYYKLADVIVLPSIFEGLPLTAIEGQISGVPVVTSTAVPEEAEIGDGCVRIDLNDKNWADIILRYENKEVHLDDRSKAYNIKVASKTLENWYLNRAGN